LAADFDGVAVNDSSFAGNVRLDWKGQHQKQGEGTELLPHNEMVPRGQGSGNLEGHGSKPPRGAAFRLEFSESENFGE
jgi:hypothetical protein